MEPSNPALAKAMAMANEQRGPAFNGEFEEYCSTWMTATITEDATPEVKIADLSEGHTYRFRVKAVNAAGPSWPSMPTDEVVCKVRTELSVEIILASQCGNFRTFLSFRFYVKSLSESLEVLKLPFLPFFRL